MGQKLNRHSFRIRDYDYSQPGFYFITVCSYQRRCIFEQINDGKMELNICGEIVKEEWLKTEAIRPGLSLGSFVVMPNHFHGMIYISGDSGKISSIMSQFKSITTKRIRKHFSSDSLDVWQRNYFEHVVRGEKDFLQISYYIENNPLQWHLDEENPVNIL